MLPFDESEPAERWLPVVGWEGLYDVSSLSRVRSLPRPTARGVRGGKILSPRTGRDSRGYPMVTLARDGTRITSTVHRLVAAAFIGPCPEGQEVRHGPGGKLDASLANLCYGTRAQNIQDRVRDGQDCRGERHYGAKFTWAIVAGIKRRVAAGEEQAALAREFDVTATAIWGVVNGRTWRYPPA
jgi:hypothetical protein